MLIWTARVSVTRKLKGSNEMLTCKESQVSKRTYLDLMRAIEAIMNVYSADMWCTTVVIQKLNTL